MKRLSSVFGLLSRCTKLRDWERFLREQKFSLSVEALRTPNSTFGVGEGTERKEFTIRKVSQEEAKEAFKKYGREAVDICALHRKADNLY